jgi:hypothetical protein
VEDAAPSVGVPSYLEMPEHYGNEAWVSYAGRAIKQLVFDTLDLAKVFGLLSLGPSPSAEEREPTEFVENVAPAPGLPDLCSEYHLRALEIGQADRPVSDEPAAGARP